MKKCLPVILLFGLVSLVLAGCLPVSGMIGIAGLIWFQHRFDGVKFT